MSDNDLSDSRIIYHLWPVHFVPMNNSKAQAIPIYHKIFRKQTNNHEIDHRI